MEPLGQLNQYLVALPSDGRGKEELALFIVSSVKQKALLNTLEGACSLLHLRAKLITSRDESYVEAIKLFKKSLGVRCCDRIVYDMTPLSEERIADLRQWLLYEPHVEHPLSDLIRGLAKFVVQEGQLIRMDSATAGTYLWSPVEEGEVKLVVKPQCEERGCKDNPCGWDEDSDLAVPPGGGAERALIVQRLFQKLKAVVMPCTVRALLPFRDGVNSRRGVRQICLVHTFIPGRTVDECLASDETPSFPDAHRKQMQAIAVADIILGSVERYGGDVVVRESDDRPMAIGNGACLSMDKEAWRTAWISWGQPNQPLNESLRERINELTLEGVVDLCLGGQVSPLAIRLAQLRLRLLQKMIAFNRGGFRLTLGDVGRVCAMTIHKEGDNTCRFARMATAAIGADGHVIAAFDAQVDEFLGEVNGALDNPDLPVQLGKHYDRVLFEICLRVPTESEN